MREIISQTKIDPSKDLTEEINIILKNYIISLMKPLEKGDFFNKKEKLRTWKWTFVMDFLNFF